MARFARVDKNNIVQRVHIVDNEHLLNENGEEEEAFGVAYLNQIHGYGLDWIQGSFNTRGGVHREGGTPLRKNCPHKGWIYDRVRDAFIPGKKPADPTINDGAVFNSWILNEDSCLYDPPIPYPDESGGAKQWNEVAYQADNTKGWQELSDFTGAPGRE